MWAICKECCLTLRGISSSSETLQSLCVMLETLAFDSTGNVCFVDYESGVYDDWVKPSATSSSSTVTDKETKYMR